MGRIGPAAAGKKTGPMWPAHQLAPRAPPAAVAVYLSFGFPWKPACCMHAKQGNSTSSAANNRSQSHLSCCCRAGWHGTGLTSKRQSPPMSPLLSKQVGTSPSSRQHFRAHRPEAPAPMMATLRAAMSCSAVVAGMQAKLQPGAKHARRGAEPGRSHRGDVWCCSVGDGSPHASHG